MTDTPATPALKGRARLESARAAKAELDARVAAAGLTEPAETVREIRYVSPGDTVHVLRSGSMVNLANGLPNATVVVERGRSFVVTSEMLEATRNRLGELGGVALAADEAAQLARWGEVRFRVGPAPDDLRPWIHGDADWSSARERARRAAHAQPTDELRAEALRAVQEIYGSAPTTSYSLNTADHPSIAAAQAQQDRRAARNGA